MKKRRNIVLVGMPGAGKSTVGVILAKADSREFVDTDLLIQSVEGRSLQDVVDQDGYLELRKIEEEVLSELDVINHVVATGGSAVYSSISMGNLKRNGIVVYLDVSLAALEARVNDFTTRGLAKRPDQSFDDLFAERKALYEKYADITIKCDDLNQNEVCERVMAEAKAALAE